MNLRDKIPEGPIRKHLNVSRDESLTQTVAHIYSYLVWILIYTKADNWEGAEEAMHNIMNIFDELDDRNLFTRRTWVRDVHPAVVKLKRAVDARDSFETQKQIDNLDLAMKHRWIEEMEGRV